MKHKKGKRFLSGFLACLTLAMTILTAVTPITSYAAAFTGKNIWSGGSEVIFGSNRSYLYRWSDGFQNTFCIEPGLHMGKNVNAYAGRYYIDDENIPYIDSKEDFQRLALICDWFERSGGGLGSSNDVYAAAQVAVWAVVTGQWESASSMAAKVTPHISGNVNARMSQLLNYVDTAYPGANGLPDWCSTDSAMAAENPQNMMLVDGTYKLELDLSSCPDLANVSWQLPEGFIQSVLGNTLTLIYNGVSVPAAEIVGTLPPSMNSKAKNREWLGIFSPENTERDQAMISAGAESVPNKVYINIGGATTKIPNAESPVVEIFRHKETFESNYLIDLQKYCAETGLDLEGSTFDVLEAFDSSQLGNGQDGTVAEKNMSPRPATWSGFRNLGQMLTDENGHAEHSERKFYSYNKTYCGGHPEPEYVEVPELEEDPELGESNQDEVDAAEAENERLRAEWEELVRLCEEECDFHSIEEGEAEAMMIEDRDETYRTFTNLVYQYTVQEQTARTGYIIHGNHNDDQAIEVIATNASEAGANATVTADTRALNSQSIARTWINTGLTLAGSIDPWLPGAIESVLPEVEETSLDARRLIHTEGEILATASEADEEELPLEEGTPSNAKRGTPSNAEKGTPSKAKKAKKTKQSAKIQALSHLSKATSSDADNDALDNDSIDLNNFEEWQEWIEDGYCLYQYILNPMLHISQAPMIATATASEAEADQDAAPGLLSRFFSLFSDEGDDDMPPTVSVSLPEPELDSAANVVPGPSGNLSYSFHVENHRTEGEIHINKRDLDMFHENETDSYGKTQGDGTLQGAVYGLFAAADLVHLDGKTGVVYSAGDLVAIATTDTNGDASFLVFTEESDTSRAAANRAGTWIGHPLLLGSYYVRELSRSEGYELSVTGINLTESNRTGGDANIYLPAGEVSATGLSHRIDNQDGSWNDTTVSYYKTEHGFDVVISGYPEHSEIFTVDVSESNETNNAVIDSQLVPKYENGDPVYQLAAGGELKLDASGNPIELGGEDISNPLTETWYTYYRAGSYPSGTAAPQIDPVKWMDPLTVDEMYLQEEVNDMLSQLGYKVLDETDGGGAPWITLQLTGTTNEGIGTEILDWYADHNFWNAGAVESITFNGSNYEARIFYDYKGQSGSAIYDSLNGTMYIKKSVAVSGGAASSYAWIAYPAGSYSIGGFFATVRPKMEFEGTIPFGDDMDDYLVAKHQPLYDRYAEGDILLDLSGNPIPVMEWEYVYGPVTEVVQEETLTPVQAAYDPVAGTYTVHVNNVIDWTSVTEKQKITYRVQAPETSIIHDGAEMDYSDYLVKVKGAGVSVLATREELLEGSYVKYQDLVYPGQVAVYQDGGTRTEPVIVLQRAIKQSIKVTKDISEESYNQNNTYKIHRDPFTILFGGYIGSGKKYIADFHFKAYLVADLADAGLLEIGENGAYDYKKLFHDESRRSEFDQYAIKWDKPEKDLEGDLTTIHAGEGNGNEPYYGRSIMLPYGTYVIVEQIPRNLINKHYELDDPQEVTLPFVPQVDPDGTVHEDIPSSDYLYFSSYTPEELQDKFLIRFNEENHVIEAHSHDGNFQVYKYGLNPDLMPNPYGNSIIGERYRFGESENAGSADSVYYPLQYDQAGNVIDYGVTLSGVDTMTGISTAINGKYAAALVPWSVLDPRYGEVINDNGDIGNRDTGLENGSFNFVGFAKKHFENTFYSSKLRVEKVDAHTGENIIHEGALFKIYAVSRDVAGAGASSVTGTGQALFETITVTGTRTELEARGDVDNITWDDTNKYYKGTVTQPVYDESEQIYMLNEIGEEVGIFKVFSTEHSVMKADGSISKEKTGYIETFQPLGAGAYVLVEVQAPEGYQKSKPIAFEIYKDETAYYPEGDSGNRTISDRYQYVIPMTSTEETQYQDVSKVIVQDYPSKLYIHKVEDGDQKIGDVNGLDGLESVNDKGDLLTYIVRGRKEYLEARGDVEHITWDAANLEYQGTVTKTFDEWSEYLIEGTEAGLLARDDVKVLYHVNNGYFSGYGIKYDNYIKEAVMSLYEGLQVVRTGYNTWEGITVTRDDGKVVSITASKTGSHFEITTNERDTTPPYYRIWDTETILNEPVELYFYDLSEVDTEMDEITGELWILDIAGNRICYADPVSGMAYSKDDYGNLIAYKSENGEKVLAQSIEVHNNGSQDHIYVNLVTEDDEVGLPLYYESGELTYRPERWTTDEAAHEIERLPFGAYILEESEVPHDQGYIKVPDMGLILRESSEEQHFYYQNVFTKLNLAKIDVTTKEEIRDAGMTLYTTLRIEDDSERGYHLEKDQVYTSWISGYEYDDNGDLKLDGSGEKIPTLKPHWIDHIPPGDYILEETVVPYTQGYVQSESIEITVTETGNVQTGYMEDDYTGLEIKKFDSKTGQVLDNDHSAKLALYKAELDADGKPLINTIEDIEIPVYQEQNLIVEWQTEDGADILASGHEVTDEYGDTYTVYDYNRVPITTTSKGYYYITENGTTMFHYLPVGYYVLVEEGTPETYATADPILIEIEDIGHLEKIHYYEMPDVPLTIDISKAQVSGGKEVKDAFLQIFKVDEFGIKEDPALYEWYSGSDGVYTDEDLAAGQIPEGLEVGDLRPHRIEYIPLGDYILVEKITPYGFLQSVEIPFTIIDTQDVQFAEMIDEIPNGLLHVTKRDSQETDWMLESAEFEFWNKTTGELIETLVTDETGQATASNAVPIGYLNTDGSFSPYTFEVVEINAPITHMINRLPYEFQFQYQDEFTELIHVTYDAVNDINQVKISKKEITTKDELPGAEMMVREKDSQMIVDYWISTEQPHYISGILPGIYQLIEIKTPGSGYVIAELIEFEVTENMEVIPYIEMFDDHTKIDIEKIAGTTTNLLAGAKLQLETIPKGEEEIKILYQWITSADEPYRINGLEPGEYLLRELEAPAGYKIGSPMKLVVEETTDVQTFEYRNYRVTTGGGGGTTTPPKPRIPETPIEEAPKIGRIEASYENDSSGKGRWTFGGLPRTGDDSTSIHVYFAGLLLMLSALVFGSLLYTHRRKKEEKEG
ncbi:MAG: SrtB family sortase [Hungatella sp.]|nr:SrtB family sortase [Hungatella sp.]